MPVTVTAKRALRSSKNKAVVKLEVAMREAKKGKTQKAVRHAMSLADRAAKKRVIHKNKAARIKSSLSKIK
jgi:ribosomal protein S20